MVLPVVLALLAGVGCSYLAWREYRRSQELFTPWALMLVYATLDVFLPAAIFLLFDPPSLASWIIPLRDDDIATATLLYVAALGVFGAAYFFIGREPSPGDERTWWARIADVRLRVGRVYAGLTLTGGWYVLHQLTLVRQAGSFDAYLSDQFRQRFRPDVYVARNALDFVFNQLAPAMLPAFLVMVGILFFFRHRHGRPFMWGLLFPLIGWILTLTTFYRGSQLNLFLALALLETLRLRVGRLHPQARLVRSTDRRTMFSARNKVLAGIGVLLFLGYGAYRHYNAQFQYGRPVSASEAIASQSGEFTRGWGLVGLTSILRFYPSHADHLGAGSVTSTFLMPVPRFVWPDKPERYGAEVVTRQMGWLTTTQSAITMPGEFYADFGLIGVLFVGAFGLFFRSVYRRRSHPQFFFVYAFFLPQAALLTHWMSSTGLMTAVTLFPAALVAVMFVLVHRSDTTEPGDERDSSLGWAGDDPRLVAVAANRRRPPLA